jgi:hypothetical protein
MPVEPVGNKEPEKEDSDLEKAVKEVEEKEQRGWVYDSKNTIAGNWLIYKWLSFMVNRMKCDNIKILPNNAGRTEDNSARTDSVKRTTELKRTGR